MSMQNNGFWYYKTHLLKQYNHLKPTVAAWEARCRWSVLWKTIMQWSSFRESQKSRVHGRLLRPRIVENTSQKPYFWEWSEKLTAIEKAFLVGKSRKHDFFFFPSAQPAKRRFLSRLTLRKFSAVARHTERDSQCSACGHASRLPRVSSGWLPVGTRLNSWRLLASKLLCSLV